MTNIVLSHQLSKPDHFTIQLSCEFTHVDQNPYSITRAIELLYPAISLCSWSLDTDLDTDMKSRQTNACRSHVMVGSFIMSHTHTSEPPPIILCMLDDKQGRLPPWNWCRYLPNREITLLAACHMFRIIMYVLGKQCKW